MDSAGWPVDLPRAEVHVELGRRRHRKLTVPAGVLLFLCLFLPAVKGCNSEPVYAIEMPYFWHPYLYGAVLAGAALAATQRALVRAVLAVRVLALIELVGSVFMILVSGGLGVIMTAIAAVQLAIIGVRGTSEKRLAGSGIVISVVSMLWFGLWSGSAGALVGIYVSLVGSIFLLAGSLHWLSEI